jgi:hypothetical protein
MLGHYHLESDAAWVDDPCPRCGGESVPNVCAGAGRYHHHGRIHTVEGGLEPLCRMCAELDGAAWRARGGQRG